MLAHFHRAWAGSGKFLNVLRAQRQPRRIWSLKKLALELFHNSSPAESEAPGTKINSLV
jgi:hypothetical protein